MREVRVVRRKDGKGNLQHYTNAAETDAQRSSILQLVPSPHQLFYDD
jgi:hypothetical protein